MSIPRILFQYPIHHYYLFRYRENSCITVFFTGKLWTEAIRTSELTETDQVLTTVMLCHKLPGQFVQQTTQFNIIAPFFCDNPVIGFSHDSLILPMSVSYNGCHPSIELQ